jgi:hypothetical protein
MKRGMRQHIDAGFKPDINRLRLRVRVMVFNVTFTYISVISWRPVLLVEETGIPGENHRHAASLD